MILQFLIIVKSNKFNNNDNNNNYNTFVCCMSKILIDRYYNFLRNKFQITKNIKERKAMALCLQLNIIDMERARSHDKNKMKF